MNDTNNNLNGTVLGSLNNNPEVNSNPMNNEEIEVLDSDFSTSVNMDYTSEQINYQEGLNDSQNTFFNNPPINDLNNDVENSGFVNEVPQVVEPTPAYTNPQYINPMPGFENSNMIGITPPISFEPEKKPKKKGNKILFVIIVLLALVGVGFGTYYILNYTKQKEEVIITTKDFHMNVGEVLSTNIEDYAVISGTDVRNCNVNTDNVNMTAVGIYEYTVACGTTQKKGRITVIDNRELMPELITVYKAKNGTLEAKEFAKTVDENLTYEFVEPEVVNNYLNGEPGTYTVKIKVTSNTNKTAELEANLVIMAIKGYITCTSKEEKIKDINASMTIAERFAIVNDDSNSYGNIAYEIHTFKFTDETEYANYLAIFKTENKITINNITGDAKFDDQNLTITITNNKDNNLVISEYGKENIEKYSTIRSYFTTKLKYSCVYKITE